jgi:hypothetical protein
MASSMKEKALVMYIDEKVNAMAKPLIDAIDAKIEKAKAEFGADKRKEEFFAERLALKIECGKKIHALMRKHNVRDTGDRSLEKDPENLVSFNYADADILIGQKELTKKLEEEKAALIKKRDSVKNGILVRMMLKGATMDELEKLLKEVKF